MKNQFLVLLVSSLFLFSCGDAVSDIEGVASDEAVVSELTPERAEKAKEVFRTIPSPIEASRLFNNIGVSYNATATNSVENISKYSTNGQKALNLGVYGADLSYANIFDQSEQSMKYINCAKKMSDALDISSAFDVATIERIEDSMNNRDSLMAIVDDVFWIIDTHLKENGQDHLSALVLAGGWIEGLYLGSVNLNKENPNVELMKKIADQKSSLLKLFELLVTYGDTEVVSLVKEMKPLQLAYNKINATNIDEEIIFEIVDASAQIRKKITQ